MSTATHLDLALLEDLDVEDLLSLPKGFRYELHRGNLVIMAPSSFWRKALASRLMVMLHSAGHDALLDAGMRGFRPRDCRLPDVGVVTDLPPGKADYSTLPPSHFSLVVEIVSRNSPMGEFLEKRLWYAEHGIPEYWIVEETPDRADEDGVVTILRLDESSDKPDYAEVRSLLVSELEAEYRS